MVVMVDHRIKVLVVLVEAVELVDTQVMVEMVEREQVLGQVVLIQVMVVLVVEVLVLLGKVVLVV